MTSREIIRRCVHFENPPRVGFYMGGPEIDDTVIVFDFFMKDEHGRDPWGQEWVVHPEIPTIGMIKEYPLAEVFELSRVKAPDAKDFAQRVARSIANLSPAQRDKYRVIATSSGIWERSQNLRGLETLCEDLVLRPELVHQVVNFCADFWVAFLKELAPLKGKVDAIYMFDDWGTQLDAMVSPAMWREFFAEPYRRITTAAHQSGLDFWLHSCGRVTNLIEEFIAVGMDLVNPYQSATCGYEEVARRYAGRIAFLTLPDSQSTMPKAPPAQIVDECHQVARWGTSRGGLIVAVGQYDAPPESTKLVYDTFAAMGKEM